jgi:hypothetical protein
VAVWRFLSSVPIVRGVMSMAPAATARIAASTSPAAWDLCRNALAPASTATMRAVSLASRDRKMSFTSGISSRMRPPASAPVPSGSL